jgi:hypothetical protein
MELLKCAQCGDRPGFELYVPMKVDIKYGPSWGQMIEQDIAQLHGGEEVAICQQGW